ncbi:MAG: hypothetical protein ACXAC5_02380 [Promethearchaeota archaeon]|jgi:hypothetical protein
MSDRVYQEFYCASSGGGCGGYITVRINMALNGVVEIICPKCGHKHQRCLKQGVLMEQGRHSKSPTQELCPTEAAWSEEAKHPESKKRAGDFNRERDAVVIDESSQESRGKLCPFLAELWYERFGGE